MSYFACFKKISGHIFRFDTRIYIGSSYSIGERGECIGAIIGKNPGSALPTKYNQLCQISLNGDKMLPSVRNRFADSFRKAGVEPPRNAFVRVWNLFYLCNPKLSVAIKEFEDITVHEECWTEHQDAPPIVWYAWGGSHRTLDLLKNRFLNMKSNCFYYDKSTKSIVPGSPKADSFPKHPQGMPSQCVVDYMSSVVRIYKYKAGHEGNAS